MLARVEAEEEPGSKKAKNLKKKKLKWNTKKSLIKSDLKERSKGEISN